MMNFEQMLQAELSKLKSEITEANRRQDMNLPPKAMEEADSPDSQVHPKGYDTGHSQHQKTLSDGDSSPEPGDLNESMPEEQQD